MNEKPNDRPADKPIDKRPATILLVDDNVTNLNVLVEYLSAEGYRVLVAEDGYGAIEQTHFGLPDLILLDVMMPGIDGFETCRRLKADPLSRPIPVIFMTAISDTPYILEGFAVGAVDYLTKPLQREEVNARVKNHIAIRKLQRELETEIAVRQKAEEELRVLSAGKDVFFSILAHDLKNPMAGLLGLTESLVAMVPKDADDELRETAVDIRTVTGQIGELLLDLLSWAQIQLGKVEPVPDNVDLKQAVEFAVALVEAAALRKQISIVNMVREPVEIWCDARMNDTVLRNLLSNAVKFTPLGGTILISAQPRENDLVVTVADTGKGITADRVPGLFQLGMNKPTFGTKSEKGTGLGLPLCREMAEKNGGKIWVESAPGEGAKFSFSVPVRK